MQRKLPSIKERIQQSQNFRNGSFQNLSVTPMKPEDVTYFTMLRKVLKRPADVRPPGPMPTVRTDLKALYSEKPVVTWFGHSSYLIHVKGFNILVDPVFSGSASPMSFMVKAFPGADAYTPADMPEIDLMIITHNHYDHLDKKTLAQLKPHTKRIYTSLGVGYDLQRCVATGNNVTEMDWWETREIAKDITLTATPARHFSGRGIKRGGSLWSSFVLEIFGYKIFIGGDSGYDTHFKAIGDKFGPFDLVILECGQYNDYWPFIHMNPEETVQAAIDLQARALLPVHWGKFVLAMHAWNDSPKRVTTAGAQRGLLVTTPRIGEPVTVGAHYPQEHWWE
ncbi:L-ascorbate metabolism protein UlaG, beta-lactamase superfamily [Chitinophaga ginsengisegetis]|uniref:L-ascorbate metabolism protein UlaG, beta-lactamase superfamily n=1 Tax=Chitinophaga ginsengisegetis TaxID=393003 RepID=A0A1T5NWC8_9BACT|nr:MBL fold metallo-hydrolase [Chitinophaga ginsengisegetis]SKD04755.1 L-ascorbate metabolism protein UlaG, beta-lactamase superfamily [Chitinophaga ginsengisegetis]